VKRLKGEVCNEKTTGRGVESFEGEDADLSRFFIRPSCLSSSIEFRKTEVKIRSMSTSALRARIKMSRGGYFLFRYV